MNVWHIERPLFHCGMLGPCRVFEASTAAEPLMEHKALGRGRAFHAELVSKFLRLHVPCQNEGLPWLTGRGATKSLVDNLKIIATAAVKSSWSNQARRQGGRNAVAPRCSLHLLWPKRQARKMTSPISLSELWCTTRGVRVSRQNITMHMGPLGSLWPRATSPWSRRTAKHGIFLIITFLLFKQQAANNHNDDHSKPGNNVLLNKEPSFWWPWRPLCVFFGLLTKSERVLKIFIALFIVLF